MEGGIRDQPFYSLLRVPRAAAGLEAGREVLGFLFSFESSMPNVDIIASPTKPYCFLFSFESS